MASPNPCSVELEVMTKNYARLCEILSPVIEDMLPKLISEKVITYENKKNILGKPTGTYKAEALLDDTIKTSLSVGYPDNFYKLLKVMKDTKSSACIQLVDSMIDDGMPSVLVTKFNLRGDGIKSRKSTDHRPASHIQQQSPVSKLIPKSSFNSDDSQKTIQKTSVTILHEYCQQRKIQAPYYDIQQVENGGGFYCRVKVEGKLYIGLTKPSKKEAKQSAAEKAVEIHISTPAPGDTLPSSSHKSPSISQIQQLKMKYFDQKSVPFSFRKSYFVTKPVDGGFQCILTIPRQRDFKSAVLPSKLAAENDAAKCALKFFKL